MILSQSACMFSLGYFLILFNGCYCDCGLTCFLQVEQLRRTNKIWANDNIHLFKILKVPVKKDSPHYLEELEVSEDESGTEDSGPGINEDRPINNGLNGSKGKQCGATSDGSSDQSKEGTSEEQRMETALSFLEQLDARIKSSKKESEKLR